MQNRRGQVCRANASWKKQRIRSARLAGCSTRTSAPNEASLRIRSMLTIRSIPMVRVCSLVEMTLKGSKNGLL